MGRSDGEAGSHTGDVSEHEEDEGSTSKCSCAKEVKMDQKVRFSTLKALAVRVRNLTVRMNQEVGATLVAVAAAPPSLNKKPHRPNQMEYHLRLPQRLTPMPCRAYRLMRSMTKILKTNSRASTAILLALRMKALACGGTVRLMRTMRSGPNVTK